MEKCKYRRGKEKKINEIKKCEKKVLYFVFPQRKQREKLLGREIDFLPFFKKGSAADFCDPGTLFSQSVNIHLKTVKC